jgi:hypothetical protein
MNIFHEVHELLPFDDLCGTIRTENERCKSESLNLIYSGAYKWVFVDK